MMSNTWTSVKNLTVVLSYRNEERYTQFRKALDMMLNDSEVQDLWLVVVLPGGIKKDESIASRMSRKSDMVLWFEMNDKKPVKLLSTLPTKTMVAVGIELSTAQIQIQPTTSDPSEIVTFVQQTLQKINDYE